MKYIYIILLTLFLSTSTLYSFETLKNKEELISAYIYLLSKNISWVNEKDMQTFKIIIVKNNFKLYNKFKEITNDVHLKNKTIQIIYADSIDDINYKDAQVIFLGNEFGDDIKSLYKNIKTYPTLIISENNKYLKYSMINLYEDKKSRLNIEINLNNIQTHGLDVNNEILLSSASKVGVGKLYHSSIVAIKKQEEKFKYYQELNTKLQNDLKQYESEIAILNKNIQKKVDEYNKTILNISKKEHIIRKKEQLLEKKEHQIKLKEQRIKTLQQALKLLRKNLSLHKGTLNKKIASIKKQRETLKKYLDVLEKKQSQIKKLDKQIRHQEDAIKLNKEIRDKQQQEIKQQKTSLYLIGVIAILLFLFVIYFYKNKLKHQKINEKLQLAKNEAIFANKSKSIFISKMSHELRTPLNAILGFSDLLLEKNNLNSDDIKALKVINNSGTFLLTLINDILNISSIESNKIILQESTVNIKNLLNDVAILLQNSVDAKSLKLDLKYENNGIECVKTDDKLIKQILLNLITNSIKYSNHGTISVEIKIDKNYLKLNIADEGVGINKDELKYIFEPFKQVGDASSATGSGLGLAIVKQFVEIMDGDISVKSVLNEGTTFNINIPYKKCQSKEITKTDTNSSSKQIVGVFDDTKTLKILIAEDKENNILLLTKILDVLNFDIKIAKNGEEAVKLFETFHPDLIFMDKRMPKMNGDSATKIIRNLTNGDSVKIVMLSANAFGKNSIENYNIDEFILKPYKAQQIYDVIKKYFDVRYIYKDKNIDTNTLNIPHKKFKKHLKELDKKLLDELFDSTILLNYDDMKNVMDKIKKIDPTLYDILKTFVKEINFMEIINTIDELRA
jgi:signal transduction histidine kinase/DNA-binding NarL/FixJ family response regulator